MADKSALARMTERRVHERMAPLVENGDAATCAMNELEVLYSAQSHRNLVETRERRELAYDRVKLDESVFERGLDVQQAMARDGDHRVPIPDLVVAAAAAEAELTVLHYDEDFERIAGVTGQPTQWVVPRGSLES